MLEIETIPPSPLIKKCPSSGSGRQNISFDSKGFYQFEEVFGFKAEYLGSGGAIAVSLVKRLRD